MVQWLSHQIRRGPALQKRLGDFTVAQTRAPADAPDTSRIEISGNDGTLLELLPTKGLSVGRWETPRGDVFWKIPVEGLVSPDAFDPLGSMLVNGEEVRSLRWIENFAGAIELLGLTNWGMPVEDPATGFVLPLHGEASQIPVEWVRIEASGTQITATAAYDIRDRFWIEPQPRAIPPRGPAPRPETPVSRSPAPWYRRGDTAWRLERSIRLDRATTTVRVTDRITNMGTVPRRPDWGYHVQLRPESGARFTIPSEEVTSRFGGSVPPEFRTWLPAEVESIRTERGYIHRGCITVDGPEGQRSVVAHAEYPTLPPVSVTFPEAPYVLSWFSCGGTGGREFDRPERPDGSYMKVGWNGFGPEIGATPLDHDGNADPAANEPLLEPGETRTLIVEVRQHER